MVSIYLPLCVAYNGSMSGPINIQSYITFTSKRITIQQKRALTYVLKL